MPEISEHYTLNMMTLSPLHVGSGRDLLRDYDYVVHRGRTWRVDEDALFDAAMGDADFDAALIGRPAVELLQDDDYRPGSDFFRYVVKGMPRSQREGAQLSEQIKDAFNRPYLPGSSLKGAFRTAVFDWALAQNPRALDTDRLKQSRNWVAQPIERSVLGRDPNHDLLRALHVADSAPLDPDDALTIENAQVVTGKKTGSPVELEALRPEVRLRTTVKIDLALFTDQAEQELRMGDKLSWLRDLMGLCRARVTPILAAEQAWFARNYPGSPVAAFYSQLHQLVKEMRDERCLLQVGWGGGWHSKTVGPRLSERQKEDVIRSYRLARGRRGRGDPFPSSRRVALDRQGQPVAPFGWLLIEMKREGDR